MQLPFIRRRRQALEPNAPVPAAPAPLPPRRRRRWPFVLVAGVALLAAALASQPVWLAPLVAHGLAASSGRPVRIGAVWLGLDAELRPVLNFRDVDIANAPWAAHARPFAVVGSGAAVVSWRSVAERRPVIDRLVLRDARIDMERLADGRRNWRLPDPEDRSAGRYEIRALEAERSVLYLVHRGINLDLEMSSVPKPPGADAATGLPSGAADAELPARLALRGRWQRLAFSATVDTGAELTFRGTGRATRFRGALQAGGARLRADGRAGDLFLQPTADARIELEGDRLGPLREVFGGRPDDGAPLRTYRLSGRFTAARQAYAVREASARVGSTDLAGEIGIVHGEPRSRVSATLQSRSASLADLTWLAGVAAPETTSQPPAATAVAVARATSAAARAAARAASAPAAPTARPFDGLRRVDADLRFDAARFAVAAWPAVESLRFSGRIDAGRVDLPQLDLGIGRGHAVGRFGLDARGDPAPARLELDWRDVRIEALLRDDAATAPVRGGSNGRLRLSATGATTRDWLASATGSASATLSGGRISGLLDAQLGLQGGRIVRGLLLGAEPVPLRCAAGSAEFSGGIATLQDLVVDTARTRVTGRGRVDLARATLDLTLTPQPKERSLLDLDRSIRIHGALKQPERELVARRAPTPAACEPG